METRIVVKMCDQNVPDAVVQLAGNQVSMIAESLAQYQPDPNETQHCLKYGELLKNFFTISSMLTISDGTSGGCERT